MGDVEERRVSRAYGGGRRARMRRPAAPFRSGRDPGHSVGAQPDGEALRRRGRRRGLPSGARRAGEEPRAAGKGARAAFRNAAGKPRPARDGGAFALAGDRTKKG